MCFEVGSLENGLAAEVVAREGLEPADPLHGLLGTELQCGCGGVLQQSLTLHGQPGHWQDLQRPLDGGDAELEHVAPTEMIANERAAAVHCDYRCNHSTHEILG